MNPANKHNVPQMSSTLLNSVRDPQYDTEAASPVNTKRVKTGLARRLAKKLHYKKHKGHKDNSSVYSGDYATIEEDRVLDFDIEPVDGDGVDSSSTQRTVSDTQQSSGYGSLLTKDIHTHDSESLKRQKQLGRGQSYIPPVVVHTHHVSPESFVLNLFKRKRGLTDKERQLLDERQARANFMFAKQNTKHAAGTKLRNLTEYEQQLYDAIYDKMEHIKRLRNIDFSKPVRVVFVDYKSVVSQHIKDKKQLTSLGYAIVDSKYAMKLKDNTLYVLLPNPELGNDLELRQYMARCGIFDLCVHLPEKEKAEVTNEPLSCANDYIQVFKHAIISQLIHVLRRHYNVPKVSAVLIDDSEKFRSDMEHTFKRVGIDNMAIVDPNTIETEHTACAFGRCNNENHLFFSGGSLMEPEQGVYSACAFFPVLEASMVSPYKCNTYVTDEIQEANTKDQSPVLDSLQQPSDDRLGRIVGTSVFKRKHSDITLHDFMNILFILS